MVWKHNSTTTGLPLVLSLYKSLFLVKVIITVTDCSKFYYRRVMILVNWPELDQLGNSCQFTYLVE